MLQLLLSIFVNFITKKAYYTSPAGISITIQRCDLYDRLDSFVLSTFHRIKLEYVTTTKKSVCLLLVLLYGDIESQPILQNICQKILTFSNQKALQSIDSEKRESIIIGDMNVNYLIENDHEVIKDIFTDNGFKQILNTPTCVTDQTSSLT